jgi:hypothetical protein
MLQKGQTATIVVNKPERDALDQVLKRHGSVLDTFERKQLESLLKKAGG